MTETLKRAKAKRIIELLDLVDWERHDLDEQEIYNAQGAVRDLLLLTEGAEREIAGMEQGHQTIYEAMLEDHKAQKAATDNAEARAARLADEVTDMGLVKDTALARVRELDGKLAFNEIGARALRAQKEAAEASLARAEQERDVAYNLFWPPADDREQHIFEIRNGKNADYVRAHVDALIAEAAEETRRSLLALVEQKKRLTQTMDGEWHYTVSVELLASLLVVEAQEEHEQKVQGDTRTGETR